MADTGIGTIETSVICKSEVCSGCGACVNICPQRCIKFEEDEYGQKRPVIEKTHCIECNLCKKTCPNNRQKEEIFIRYPQMVYAGWRNEISECRLSSSGGVASVIAEHITQTGGIVYGVTQKQENVLYQRADTVETVREFRGSKYTQADSVEIYTQIEQDICDRKRVLVIGTPCLIAGIISYLDRKKLRENYHKYLVTIDLLCHGNTPQSYLKEHIEAIRRKNSVNFDEITFRSNIPGENYRFILKENGKTVYSQRAESDLYFYGFLSSVTVRESCVNCGYKCSERCGDISLGDFLGLGREIPFSADRTGIHPSLILINSDTGRQIIQSVEGELRLFPRTLEEAVNGGPSLRQEDMRKDSNWMKRRQKFKTAYPLQGFEKAAKKSIGDQVLLSLTKDKMKKILKR